MHILYISPTGRSRYAEGMARLLNAARRPDTVVDFQGLPPDRPTHLEYHAYEALILPDLIRIVRARAADYDGHHQRRLLRCGLAGAARDFGRKAIVVGPCQATTAIAATLGNTFSVVVGKRKWIPRMTENVRRYGHGDRMVSMRAAELAVHDFQNRADAADRMLDTGGRCVEEDGAEVLILGCTVEFGFAARMQEALRVPVLEAIPAALKYAEMLADGARRFGWYPSRRWGSEAPPEDEIAAWGLFEGAPPQGRSLRVGDPDADAA